MAGAEKELHLLTGSLLVLWSTELLEIFRLTDSGALFPLRVGVAGQSKVLVASVYHSVTSVTL